jgi:hypothetical protein
MYTFDQTKQTKDLRKPNYKLIRKTAGAGKAASNQSNALGADAGVLPPSFQIEWPRELEPVLRPVSEIKSNCFHSVVDKVKGYILADNLKMILESFKETVSADKTDYAFETALKQWQQQDLFTFAKF